jgi:hypothetical protein
MPLTLSLQLTIMTEIQKIPLCIPRIEKHVTEEYIKQIFARLNIGKIIKITEIPLKSDPDYKRILLTIRIDPHAPNIKYINERLNSGKNIKIVYNAPWYWKMVLGRYPSNNKLLL